MTDHSIPKCYPKVESRLPFRHIEIHLLAVNINVFISGRGSLFLPVQGMKERGRKRKQRIGKEKLELFGYPTFYIHLYMRVCKKKRVPLYLRNSSQT